MHQYSVTHSNGIQMSCVHNITEILDVNIGFKFYIKHFSIRCLCAFILFYCKLCHLPPLPRSPSPPLHRRILIHSLSLHFPHCLAPNFAQFCFISYQFGCCYFTQAALAARGPSSFFIFRHFFFFNSMFYDTTGYVFAIRNCLYKFACAIGIRRSRRWEKNEWKIRFDTFLWILHAEKKRAAFQLSF